MYFKVEFAVNGDHVGMVIGTNGNNIKKAQAIPGVHLIEVTRENKVIVYADKREQADAARELLEIIHSRVPVDASEIGYIIGKGGEQIRDLQVLPRTCVSPRVSGELLARAASRCVGSAKSASRPSRTQMCRPVQGVEWMWIAARARSMSSDPAEPWQRRLPCCNTPSVRTRESPVTK